MILRLGLKEVPDDLDPSISWQNAEAGRAHLACRSAELPFYVRWERKLPDRLQTHVVLKR